MGTWMNPDGLFLKYGPTKTVPNTGGDYLSYGETREIEVNLDLTKNPAGSVINDVTFVPKGVIIEQVELVADVEALGGTSFSVGLIGQDRSTVPSDGATGFASGVLLAAVDAVGEKVILNKGDSGAGNYVGTVTPVSGYITSTVSGTFTKGLIKVRIKYRGVAPIAQ